jgi:hypothetical protein
MKNHQFLPFIEERKFPFDSKAPLAGIIENQTKKHGGNLHNLGVVTVTVTASDVRSRKFIPFSSECHLFLRQGIVSIQPLSTQNIGFAVTFRDSKIALTHYSIRSCDGDAGPDWNNSQNWCLGRFTGWSIVSRRVNRSHSRAIILSSVIILIFHHSIR